MSLHRGQVVMVDWSFSDRMGSKIRPAVVVQADFLNQRIHDTVLVLITKKSRHAQSTEVEIDPAVEKQSGLLYPSVAVCNNLMTLDQTLIVRDIGALSDAIMKEIEERLKTALAIR